MSHFVCRVCGEEKYIYRARGICPGCRAIHQLNLQRIWREANLTAIRKRDREYWRRKHCKGRLKTKKPPPRMLPRL